MTLAAVVNLILLAGCASVSSGGKDQSKDGEQGKCVSYSLSGKAPLKDCENEKCIAVSSGRDIAYWIDGERSTPGCNWHLKHVECQSEGCLYRCVETEALWLLSRSDTIVEMEKKVKGTTLPNKYRFEVEK